MNLISSDSNSRPPKISACWYENWPDELSDRRFSFNVSCSFQPLFKCNKIFIEQLYLFTHTRVRIRTQRCRTEWMQIGALCSLLDNRYYVLRVDLRGLLDHIMTLMNPNFSGSKSVFVVLSSRIPQRQSESLQIAMRQESK